MKKENIPLFLEQGPIATTTIIIIIIIIITIKIIIKLKKITRKKIQNKVSSQKQFKFQEMNKVIRKIVKTKRIMKKFNKSKKL